MNPEQSITEETSANPEAAPDAKLSKTAKEVSEYLLQNGGPDADGRAHPILKRVYAKDLLAGIAHAESLGLKPGFRPYHFVGHVATFSDPALLAEVIVKKGNALLRERFDGSVKNLITQITSKDFLAPFTDRVNGQTIRVKVIGVAEKCHNNTFLFLKRYFELTGRAEVAAKLRPYHLGYCSSGSRKACAGEIVAKRLNITLTRDYDGDLGKMIQNIGRDDLWESFEDPFPGFTITVSPVTAIEAFENNNFIAIREYLKTIGRRKLAAGLRAYHLSRTSRRTLASPESRAEMLKKLGDYLLQRKFRDLGTMIKEVSRKDFERGFVDEVADCKFFVSTQALAGKYGSSPQRMMKDYLLGRFRDARAKVQAVKSASAIESRST